jgi:DNA-directed RNA polymerase specialized sigma54-like protein
MRGGALDVDQKALLRRRIGPVKDRMMQDDQFDRDVKRFFGDEDAYFEEVNIRQPNFVQQMHPWMLRNEPLSNQELESLTELVRLIRLMGYTEANMRDIVAVLSSENLIDNEQLDNVLEAVRDQWHMLNNNNSTVVDPNEI